MKRLVTHAEVKAAAEDAAALIAQTAGAHRMSEIKLYGIPRGGIPAAYMVLCALKHGEGYPLATLVETAAEADFFVDDIYDTGDTIRRYFDAHGKPWVVLFDKRKPEWDAWLVMPWEVGDQDSSVTDNITRLLQFIGEDPKREGLLETPERVARAWAEWASGYSQDPKDVLKTFEDGATDEMVIVHDIPVVSKCEHHLADIIGTADVAYIPNGRIVGLSKIPRLVNVFARRLQVQERLTCQIADALMEHLQPRGAAVLITAAHHCMSTRGVHIHGSTTTTSALRGVFKRGVVRSEFMSLCRG